MNLFRVCYKILLKNKIVVGINFVIFLVMGIIFAQNTGFDTESIVDGSIHNTIDVGVVQNVDDEKMNGLVSFLDETFNVIEIENDEVAIKTDLFYRIVNYVVIINEDSIQSYQIPDSNVGHIVESNINNYLNTFRLLESANPELSQTELVNLTKENLEVGIEVVFGGNSGELVFIGMFYNFMVYGLLGTITMGIGVMMLTFNQKTIYDRLVVSSTKMSTRNLYLIAFSAVFAIVVWLISVGVSVMLFDQEGVNEQFMMLVLNSLVFVLPVFGLGFVIAQFTKNMIVLTAAIAVASLGLSFISGAFVPQFLLSDLTIQIATFTPSYWFVYNNELIVDMTSFNLEPLMNGILIQIGFAIAFIALALAIAKFKMEKK